MNSRAIQTARKNADSIFTTYRATPDPIFPGAFKVARLDDAAHAYNVWVPGALAKHPEGKCSCPYFEQQGVCKHIYRAVDEQEWEAQTIAEYESRVAA